MDSRRAWMQLLSTGVVLGLLAVALPGPWTAVAVAVDRQRTAGDPVGETAMLLAASILVWVLLVWAVIAAGAALLSRLPGVAGRQADRVLRLVAPAMARKVLLTVVGASMLTGVAACETTPASAAPATATLTAQPSVTVTSDAVSAAGTGQSDAGARSWVVVEGSTVHLPPRGAMSEPVSLVLAFDPIGADHDRPANRTATPQSLDLDWPAASKDPSPPVDVDWPAPAPSAGTAHPAPTPPSVTGPVHRPPPTAAPRRSVADEGVVVRRGDTLWSIAASRLPAQAGAAAIENAWHHWYSANRAVIGADPDLLLPGQILQPPPPAATSTTNG